MKIFALVMALGLGLASSAYAADIPYRKTVTLNVGQSIILKGVRAECNDTRAPSFASLNRLPKPKTGVLSDGGAGTLNSNHCKKNVPARAIKFTAKTKGTETIEIYNDKVSITVK